MLCACTCVFHSSRLRHPNGTSFHLPLFKTCLFIFVCLCLLHIWVKLLFITYNYISIIISGVMSKYTIVIKCWLFLLFFFKQCWWIECYCFAVILFLGACTKPPRLSMVTEYMEMGSLYYLIHLSGQKKKLSWRRRLKMLRDICRCTHSIHDLEFFFPLFLCLDA